MPLFKKPKNWFIKLIIIGLLVVLLPIYAYATDVDQVTLVNLTNRARVFYGLTPLSLDPALTDAAYTKAQDMLNQGYFDHTSPTGVKPWDYILNSDYDFELAGENLAMDFETSKEIHYAWIQSPKHRTNILNPNFKDIGIATVKGSFENRQTYMVVQMFGAKKTTLGEATSQVKQVMSRVVNLVKYFILGA